MVYVLSDVHGRIDRFESILHQIDLNEDDRLYVLGDVIYIQRSGCLIHQNDRCIL